MYNATKRKFITIDLYRLKDFEIICVIIQKLVLRFHNLFFDTTIFPFFFFCLIYVIFVYCYYRVVTDKLSKQKKRKNEGK